MNLKIYCAIIFFKCFFFADVIILHVRTCFVVSTININNKIWHCKTKPITWNTHAHHTLHQQDIRYYTLAYAWVNPPCAILPTTADCRSIPIKRDPPAFGRFVPLPVLRVKYPAFGWFFTKNDVMT